MLNKIKFDLKNYEVNKICFDNLNNNMVCVWLLDSDNKKINSFLYVFNIKQLVKYLRKNMGFLLSENILLSDVFLTDWIKSSRTLYL